MEWDKLSAIIDNILSKFPPFSVNMSLTSMNWISFPEFTVKLVKLSVNSIIVA